MLSEVVIRSTLGWATKDLEKWRTFAGVLRVDGRGLMETGRFREAVLHFSNAQIAEDFTKTLGEALGVDYKILRF